MPRLRQVPKREAHPAAQALYERIFGERDPVESPGTATGMPGSWWTVFADVPDRSDHTVQRSALYRRRKRKMAPGLREPGQIRTGFVRGSRWLERPP
jgi:hypothetical protein